MKQAKYQMNIGLADSENYPAMGVNTRMSMVARVLVTAGFTIVYGGASLVQSDTEPTLVLVVRDDGGPDDLHERFHAVAVALGQDCIAVRDESGHGELFGEHPWGAFDHSLFITPKV